MRLEYDSVSEDYIEIPAGPPSKNVIRLDLRKYRGHTFVSARIWRPLPGPKPEGFIPTFKGMVLRPKVALQVGEAIAQLALQALQVQPEPEKEVSNEP